MLSQEKGNVGIERDGRRKKSARRSDSHVPVLTRSGFVHLAPHPAGSILAPAGTTACTPRMSVGRLCQTPAAAFHRMERAGSGATWPKPAATGECGDARSKRPTKRAAHRRPGRRLLPSRAREEV